MEQTKDMLFCKNLKKQLERRMPVDSSLRPSRRYEDCMVSGEQRRTYERILIVIDGHMPRKAAQRLFEHVGHALSSAKNTMYNTRLFVSLWGAADRTKLVPLRRLAEGLGEIYAEKPDTGDLITSIDEFRRRHGDIELILLLTDGAYLTASDERLRSSPLYQIMLMLFTGDTPIDIEQRLRMRGLSGKTGVIRLRNETEV